MNSPADNLICENFNLMDEKIAKSHFILAFCINFRFCSSLRCSSVVFMPVMDLMRRCTVVTDSCVSWLCFCFSEYNLQALSYAICNDPNIISNISSETCLDLAS